MASGFDFDDLAEVCAAHRDAGRAVVLCHGCFDLLHVGHTRYLDAARRHGDVLVVTVTPDEYVCKGPDRPVVPGGQRAELLRALRCVDHVAVNRWPTAEPTLSLLRPAVYAKGAEYAAALGTPGSAVDRERRACEAVGGRFVLIGGEKFSSTRLLGRLRRAG
ncbi:MAG: adenylyltransferase/cytidyltransferase family protein [Planctomycetota bacterium]